MPGVPNTFANASGSIPLSQLDANFNTTLTIGTTSVGLGNTISTISNVAISTGSVNGSPVGNVTPSSGAFTTVSASGVASFADGTVGAPGWAFANDLDNGAYRIGTNNWALSCAGAKVMEFKSGGQVVMPLNPKFFAYNTSTRNNVTGDGTVAFAAFDTTDYNIGSGFSTGTDTFTAPVDGLYEFSFSVLTVNWASIFNDVIGQLVTSNATINVEPVVAGTTLAVLSFNVQLSVPIYMDAGDTAKVAVVAYKSPLGKTVGFYGGASRYTFFSGALIG